MGNFLLAIVVILLCIGVFAAAIRRGSSAVQQKPDQLASFTTSMAPPDVVKTVTRLAQNNGYEIDEISENNDRLILSDPFYRILTTASWGFFYPIYLTRRSQDSTKVEIGTKSKFIQIGPVPSITREKFVNRVKAALHAEGAEIYGGDAQAEVYGIQREREDLLGQVAQYEKLFKRAYDGASFSLDWWRAYEDEESVDEEPATPDLLRSVQERAQTGMETAAEIRSEVENTPYEEGHGIKEKTERSLNNLKVRQENFKGEESIFPPLVEVHRRVKGAEEWTRYRKELEEFIRGLEDILGSPEVRTAAANRARFPDPSTTREGVEDHSCPRCGVKNNPDARFCSNCGAGIRSGPAGQGQSPSNQMSAQPLQENGVLWVLLSVVCAAVALFFLPPLFGGLGVFLGYRAKQVGNEGGGIAMMAVSGACMLLGMIWGGLTWGVY